MPGAICDSSTLIHLAKIGRLHLLREFHKKILRKDLHEGESETIALAVEEKPEIVFLDESEARRTDTIAPRGTR